HRPLEEVILRVEALLEFVDMRDRGAALPMALSRNWQQRVGLARALVLKPDILLFDTPLTGLDPRDAGWWLDIIDDLAKGHPLLDNHPATVVATADDLRPWRPRARQFGLLRNGTLLVVRSGEELDNMTKDADGSIKEPEEEI
ncbi:MAG TPA: ATP-binding cassette domain-containing protein, partial [Candidatus Saccharimonadales bacterium]|nr:ATP-binding cassette domain-containing protein [Candidatus Saccharimonadales bacterium]